MTQKHVFLLFNEIYRGVILIVRVNVIIIKREDCMKKIVFLIGMLCLLLFGCGKENEVMRKVDFVVEVEEGRDPVVLQLTDTQIIDAGQQRTEQRLDSVAQEYWATDQVEECCYDYLHNTNTPRFNIDNRRRGVRRIR